MTAAVRGRADLRQWILTGQVPSPGTELDARTLVAAAAEQGVCGLLHADVARQRSAWPPLAAGALRELQRVVLVRGVRQLDAAARVGAVLRDRGLRSLPLKGAALVERLYDSAADRAMADVDVLALDDWPASLRALREAGFREAEAADHARSFEDPVSGTVVELHHSVTSCPGLFPKDAEGLWARSEEAGGQVERVPGTEDLLVQLALHASFQHGLVLGLVQYLDLRRLFERRPPETGRLLAVAEHAGALGALAATIEAASAVVGLRPPPALAAILAPHLPRALARTIEDARRDPLRLLAPAVPDLSRVRWALAEGRRLRLLAGTLGPREPGTPRRLHHVIARAGKLTWRWAPLMMTNRA